MTQLVEIGLSNALVAGLLALIAGLAGLVLRRRPAIVHSLWLLVLVKLVTPPLIPVPLPWPGEQDNNTVAETSSSDVEMSPAQPTEELAPLEMEPQGVFFEEVEVPLAQSGQPEETGQADEASATSDESRAIPPQLIAGCLWLVGSLLWFALAGWRLSRFARLLRVARPGDAPLVALVAKLSAELRLPRPPSVWLVPGRVAPMVWALFGVPRLILPEQLVVQLSRAALETLLLHELAHIKRGDHWVRRLEFVALGFYWWHPAMWFARRELREAEELCCDAWVVALRPRHGRQYATTLVDVLDFLSDVPAPLPALGSGLGRVSALKERLTMILRGTTSHGLGGLAKLALFSLAALVLPLVPTLARAQDQPPKIVIEKKLIDLKKAEDRKVQSDEDAVAAALKQKVAEIEALKEKLEALKKAKMAGAKAGIGKSVTVHIEISGIDAKDLEDLKKKMEILPGKHKKITIIAGQTRKVGNIEIELTTKGGKRFIKPGEKLPPKPGDGKKSQDFKKGPSAEQRLEKFEDTLRHLMKELESIKQEMKGGKGTKNVKPDGTIKGKQKR